MPLGRSHLTVSLATGLATSIDDKQLPIGQGVIELQNVRQGRVGEVVPRPSTKALATAMVGTGDALTAPWALGTLRGELVSLAGVGKHPVSTWSPTDASWATDVYGPTYQSGAIATTRRGPVMSSPTRVAGLGVTPAMAYASGYYFVAYQTFPQGSGTLVLHEMVIDAATGTVIIDYIIDEGIAFAYATVGVVNGYAVFARFSGAGLLVADRYQISALSAPPASQLLALNTATTKPIDIIVKNATTMAVLYGDSATGNLAAVDFVPSTLGVTNWIPRTSAGVAIASGSGACWLQDFGNAGTQSIVDTSAGTTNVQWALAAAGATRNATTSYVADAAPVATISVTGFTTSNNATGEFVVITDQGVPTSSAITRISERFGGAIVGGQTFYRATHLRSHAFQQNGEWYVWLEYPSNLSGARYLARIETSYGLSAGTPGPGGIVSKSQNGQVPITSFPTWISHVVSPAANSWVTADEVQLRLANQSAGFNPISTGIELVTTTFKQPGDTTTGTPREAIDSLFVPGGTLGQFDGKTYAEAGFAYNPEKPGIAASGVAGALTAGSTYYYKIVFAYTDTFGRVWRSAPSLAASQALGANTSMSLLFQTLRISERSVPFVASSRKGVTIEIYRGGANDNVTFQLVGAVANDTSVDTIAYVDSLSDTNQATGLFLYTNGGGVLPNDTIPGFSSIAVAGNRLYGVSTDDPQAVWVSNQFIPGLGLTFSEQNKQIIRDQHGPIYSIAAQPNGVIAVFKADAVYAIAGDGPDQAGRGGFQTQLASIGTGTTNPRSIVETSLGTEFLSTGTRHGWFRVGLGLTPEYIGGPVERYIGSTVVGAVLVPNESSTRYYLATGGCLVHDTVTGIWTFDTGTAATCATAYLSGAAYGTATPSVIVDDFVSQPGNDPTGNYIMRVVTPWIKMADLRGYERIYRVIGVGEVNSAPPETSVDMVVALQLNMVATNVVSQTSPSLLGPTWDWEMRYSTKSEAVRYVLTSRPGQFDHPETLKWSAIVIEYGVKQGTRPGSSGKRTT